MKAALFCVLVLAVAITWATPLDDYVNAPDPTYTYNVLLYLTPLCNFTLLIHLLQLVKQWKGLGFTAYAINLTSQTWLTAQDSSQPVWYHWLTICIPDKVREPYIRINNMGNYLKLFPPTFHQPT